MVAVAHHTKHHSLLLHPFHSSSFSLSQLQNGYANGTALWTGGQVMAMYLSYLCKNRCFNMSAIELGSGIGFTALASVSLGLSVLATDSHVVINSVLARNIADNLSALPSGSGTLQTRELDWSVSPEHWLWSDPSSITNPSTSAPEHYPQPLLAPPFDLIFSSDTVYSTELITPLLRTIHALSSPHPITKKSPSCYICVERRDPPLIDAFFASAAADPWLFRVSRIPHSKLVRAMNRGAVNWPKEDWEAIEIWKLVPSRASYSDISAS